MHLYIYIYIKFSDGSSGHIFTTAVAVVCAVVGFFTTAVAVTVAVFDV